MFPRRSSRLSKLKLNLQKSENRLATSQPEQKRGLKIKASHGLKSSKDPENVPQSKQKKINDSILKTIPNELPDFSSKLDDESVLSSVKSNTEYQSTIHINESKLSTRSTAQTTTGDILEKAMAHLISVEPKLKAIIEQNPCHLFSSESIKCKVEPFKALSYSIISQQVSTAAAKSIQTRFIALFNPTKRDLNNHDFPTPFQVCNVSHSLLRTAGLSLRKAEYIKGLAEKFYSREIDAMTLHNAPYQQVYDTLIKVRGLGKWSIEMFACFGLKHIDIFSTGDLGIQKNMAAFLGRDVNRLKVERGKRKYMSENEMQQLAENFKPSVYMWYLWKMSDKSIDAPGL